jgi:hypothetical protein
MKEISEKARPGTAGTDEILTLKQFADYLNCHQPVLAHQGWRGPLLSARRRLSIPEVHNR